MELLDQKDGVELYSHVGKFCGKCFHDGEEVFPGVPFFEERDDIDGEYKNYRFFESHEGVLIRLFYTNGEWFITTNRQLDAKKSYWADPTTSFGESFIKLASLDDLDRDKYYVFLLTPSENERRVCLASPRIYHISTNNDYDAVVNGFLKPKPLEIHNREDLDRILSEQDYKELQGVLAIYNDKAVKIYNPDYKKYYAIRGNVPNLTYRYLQLRQDQQKLKEFCHLYCDFHPEEVEEQIYSLCKKLHDKYLRAKVKKEFGITFTSRQEKHAIDLLHKKYIETRHRTTPEIVNDILTLNHPSLLNQLLKL